jgi:hypothetical protein
MTQGAHIAAKALNHLEMSAFVSLVQFYDLLPKAIKRLASWLTKALISIRLSAFGRAGAGLIPFDGRGAA